MAFLGTAFGTKTGIGSGSGLGTFFETEIFGTLSRGISGEGIGEISTGSVIFIPGGGGVFGFLTFFGTSTLIGSGVGVLTGSGVGTLTGSGLFSTGLAAKIENYILPKWKDKNCR